MDYRKAGIGTVLADDPMLSVRHIKNKGRQPIRIIIDSKLRIPLSSRVLDVNSGQQTMVVTTRQAPAGKLKELENLGIRTVIADRDESITVCHPELASGSQTKRSRNEFGMTAENYRESVLPGEDEKVSLQLLMNILGTSGITSVLIEGGSEINASALREGIVDKVVLIYSARIIGGHDSIGIVGGHSPKSLDESVFLKDVSIRRLGEDIMVEGYIFPPP